MHGFYETVEKLAILLVTRKLVADTASDQFEGKWKARRTMIEADPKKQSSWENLSNIPKSRQP